MGRMTKETFLAEVQRMIDPIELGGAHVFYDKAAVDPKGGFSNCEHYIRHLFRLWDIELDPDIFAARRDFDVVHGMPRFMDVAVFRGDRENQRHLGVMLDWRWFTHCSEATNGVARSEITRGDYRYSFLFFARHKTCVFE